MLTILWLKTRGGRSGALEPPGIGAIPCCVYDSFKGDGLLLLKKAEFLCSAQPFFGGGALVIHWLAHPHLASVAWLKFVCSAQTGVDTVVWTCSLLPGRPIRHAGVMERQQSAQRRSRLRVHAPQIEEREDNPFENPAEWTPYEVAKVILLFPLALVRVILATVLLLVAVLLARICIIGAPEILSLIHISEPTRPRLI
eukprot:4176527-Amphidinium_carterae.1